MRSPVPALALAGLCLLGASHARAQSFYGQADWAVYRATTTFGGTKGFNNLFAQAYTVGFESVLGDPRLGNYLAEVTFLKSNQDTSGEDGDANSFGYSLGASLFPYRPFPFSITATRTTGGTSPQFPGMDVMGGGVPLPPGYVPDRYATESNTLDMNWRLLLPAWPLFSLNYRRDSSSTSTGPYEGTEKNRALNALLEKDWSRVRNQLTYTAYSGESRTSYFPLDRGQKELLYNLTADLTQKLRADARAGFRDISSTFTFASVPGSSTPAGVTPPALTNDLQSYYSSGGLSYQAGARVGLDAQAGYELLNFDRNGQDVSSDAFYTIGSARYTIFDGLSVTGNANSSLRSEQIGETTRSGTQYGVGGGASYAPSFGAFQPVVGLARGVGRTKTVDGRSGDTDTWSRRAGLSVTLTPWLTAGTDFENSKATDEIFVLGNYKRWRWQTSAQSYPHPRLRLDGSWERTNLDQGLGTERLLSDYRLGQAGATWQLRPNQSLGTRFGEWRTESGGTVVNTTYGLGSYLAYFKAVRVQAEFVRERVGTQRAGSPDLADRRLYRVLGLVEYRLRLFTLGFDYRYSNNTQTGLTRYVNREWRLRIGRRFGRGVQP